MDGTSLGTEQEWTEREWKRGKRWRRRVCECADGFSLSEWMAVQLKKKKQKCSKNAEAQKDGWGVLGHLKIFFCLCAHAPNCFLAYLWEYTVRQRVLRDTAPQTHHTTSSAVYPSLSGVRDERRCFTKINRRRSGEEWKPSCSFCWGHAGFRNSWPDLFFGWVKTGWEYDKSNIKIVILKILLNVSPKARSEWRQRNIQSLQGGLRD